MKHGSTLLAILEMTGQTSKGARNKSARAILSIADYETRDASAKDEQPWSAWPRVQKDVRTQRSNLVRRAPLAQLKRITKELGAPVIMQPRVLKRFDRWLCRGENRCSE